MRVLVVSAHPDDETVGCGGTLLAHRAAGDELYWLIFTKAFAPRWSEPVIRTKEREVQSAASAYGFKQYFWPAFPSTQLDELPLNDLLSAAQSALEEARPQVVYVVHHGDIHTDHGRAFTAISVALKPFHMQAAGVQRILSFECASSTEAAPPFVERAFIPNVYRDISPFMQRKLDILGMYASEAQGDFLPRHVSSVQALGRYRGAAIGVEYAEAFMLIREIS